MPLLTKNPTTTNAWQKLEQVFEKEKDAKVTNFFKEDAKRTEDFSIKWTDFYVDYSKNRLSRKAKNLLLELAEEMELKQAIEAQFEGEKINQTENRAVGHTALRSLEKQEEVKRNLQKIKGFSREVISGVKKGHTGKAFTDVVNIGIGGSDLGPKMVVDALGFYKNHLTTHFVSNIDGDHTAEVLKKLNPETTLFIVVSKSFTTQETLTNAQTIKEWFLHTEEKDAIEKHFVAVSANPKAVKAFGIRQENIFPMWHWIGGRFSLWSSVGLSIACALGFSKFQELLDGAEEMDRHFSTANFDENIPVILGLLSIWYNNFYKAESEAVVPYSQYLEKLVPYLQQAVMESNGKEKDRAGESINYQTGTIVWGSAGSNAQHAFFQLLHQGTKMIPIDFIGFKKPLHHNKEHHDILMANFFAQAQALLVGKSVKEVEEEIKNLPANDQKRQKPYKVFTGNKPSTSILIKQLTPKSLGSLLAMYEHKIFVQGVLWNIFSYDQWGVELGKQLSKKISPQLDKKQINKAQDASSRALLEEYLRK